MEHKQIDRETSRTMRAARAMAGLSLKQVTTRTQLSKTTVSRLERHERETVDSRTLDALLALYASEGVAVDLEWCQVALAPEQLDIESRARERWYRRNLNIDLAS